MIAAAPLGSVICVPPSCLLAKNHSRARMFVREHNRFVASKINCVLPCVFAQRHTFTCSRRIHYVRESATRAREMDCPRPLNLVWQGPGPDETNFCREPQAPRGQEHYKTVPHKANTGSRGPASRAWLLRFGCRNLAVEGYVFPSADDGTQRAGSNDQKEKQDGF